MLGELGRFREKTGSGKVPAGFRESSGNRSGNRLGSRFQEGLDRFRGSRFQEPVPRLGLEVPGTGSGNRLGSTFQEPVPYRARGSRNRFQGYKFQGWRFRNRFQGSEVPKSTFPGTVLGTGSDGFRGLDRFQGFEARIGSRARGSRDWFQGSKNHIPVAIFFFPQQQNAMGSLPNIYFGVCWASWGGSGKKRVPGKFREGSGKVPMGSEAWVRGSRVPRFQSSEVPGTGSNGFRGCSEVPGTGSNGSGNLLRWVPRFG